MTSRSLDDDPGDKKDKGPVMEHEFDLKRPY